MPDDEQGEDPPPWVRSGPNYVPPQEDDLRNPANPYGWQNPYSPLRPLRKGRQRPLIWIILLLVVIVVAILTIIFLL